MISRSKNFKDEFYFFLNKFKKKENFNLLRFSDGELFMLQNKSIRLGKLFVKVDDKIKGIVSHASYDKKIFDPKKHSKFVEELTKSFKYSSPEYYKGINCVCCVGKENYDWQFKLLEKDDDDLTWSNVLLNSNYPLFMTEFYPEIQKRGAYVICNEKADLSHLSWVKGDIRIKSNGFDDLSPIEEVKALISSQNLKNEVFLFSASSFSNVAQYELAIFEPNNTYIDIGTTLSYEFKIPSKRGYLDTYYKNKSDYQTCIWN